MLISPGDVLHGIVASIVLRYGNSTRCFAKLDHYVDERMALLLSKRYGHRGRGHGLKLIIGSGNRLGLERLAGTIVFKHTAHAAR